MFTPMSRQVIVYVYPNVEAGDSLCLPQCRGMWLFIYQYLNIEASDSFDTW